MASSALELALGKLSLRAYARKELENVLRKTGFNCQETTTVLEKLVEMGYLNDENLAQDLYVYYTARKPCGPILLAEKLKQKGIPCAIIANILEDYTKEKELTLARQLAARYLAAKKTAASCRALAQYLERRGFSADTVKEIIYCYNSDAHLYSY